MIRVYWISIADLINMYVRYTTLRLQRCKHKPGDKIPLTINYFGIVYNLFIKF